VQHHLLLGFSGTTKNSTFGVSADIVYVPEKRRKKKKRL
jgi:hypothetical protein